MLTPFILGWAAGVWWPGIEVDAPKPGGGGDPWWGRLLLGVAGGIGAVVIAQVANLNIETLTGVAVSIGSGVVVASIVSAILGAVRR